MSKFGVRDVGCPKHPKSPYPTSSPKTIITFRGFGTGAAKMVQEQNNNSSNCHGFTMTAFGRIASSLNRNVHLAHDLTTPLSIAKKQSVLLRGRRQPNS